MKIKAGDRVIGMQGWWHGPYVGTLITTTLEVDPLHPILINTKEQRIISVQDSADYQRQLSSIRGEVTFISENLVCPYSKRKLVRLKKLISFLDSTNGKKYFDFEKSIVSFFQRNTFLYVLKLHLWWKIFLRGLLLLLDSLIVGTLELLFGNVFNFFKKRVLNRDLAILLVKLKKQQKSTGTSIMLSKAEMTEAKERLRTKISETKSQIERIEAEKVETSRAFLAMVVAVVSLIVAIAKK